FLLRQGYDPNVPDAEGIFPLQYAAHAQELGMVRMLLAHGADLQVRDPNGESVVHYAVHPKRHAGLHFRPRTLNPHMIDLLHHHGADLNAQDSLGDTPLHKIAAMQMMDFILVGDCALTYDIPTPALLEARATVWRLLDYGADPNIANQAGDLPIHIAARVPHTDPSNPWMALRANNDPKDRYIVDTLSIFSAADISPHTKNRTGSSAEALRTKAAKKAELDQNQLIRDLQRRR
ncbi:MAG: ankyrin repeat domain-containing protein, partial [Bacteroidota bacterium]